MWDPLASIVRWSQCSNQSAAIRKRTRERDSVKMSSNYFPNRSFVFCILFSFSNSFHSQKVTSCAPRPIVPLLPGVPTIMKHLVLFVTHDVSRKTNFYIILIVSVCFYVYFLQRKLSVALTKAVKHVQMRESDAPNLINADLAVL